jgi:site-specific recombinase XerD
MAVALEQFLNDLASDGKAPKTQTTYGEGVQAFQRFADTQGVTRVGEITERTIRDWLGSLRRGGASASTVTNRYGAIRAFCRWAVGQRQLADNLTDGIPWPKPGLKEIPVIADGQIAALLRICAGDRFEDVRDTAIIRLLLDTGMRRAELHSLRGRMEEDGSVTGDIDLKLREARVMGKGGRPRISPFGARTAQALRMYLLARYSHPEGHRSEMWIGHRGPLTASGLLHMLRRRGREAGIPGLFTHAFRHTAAHLQLAQGAQEGDLMRLMGWKTRDMLDRYGRAGADARARASYRSPGDRF